MGVGTVYVYFVTYLLSVTIVHYRSLLRTIADYRSAAHEAQRSAAVVEMPFFVFEICCH